MGLDYANPPQDMAALVERLVAIEQNMPSVSTQSPAGVALNSDPGATNSKKFAAEGHVHEARVQRNIVALDVNGQATWMFGKAFDNMPSLGYMVFQTSGRRVTVEATAWVREVMTPTPSGKYTGVVVTGSRDQPLPTLQALTVTTFVLSGVNALFALLSNRELVKNDKSDLKDVQVHVSAGMVM